MSIEKAQAARATAHLDRVLSHNGILKTARAMVIELVNQGRTAKVKTYNWKDKERTAYVLEDEAEGIFVELTKTQYLYALELIAQREAEPRPAPEEVKPGHDIGEDMTVWPVIVATLREALALIRGGMSVPQVKNFVSVKLNPDNQEGQLTTWDINMLKTLAHVSPNNFKTRLQYTRRLSVELKDAEEQLAKMQAKKDQEAAQAKSNTPRPFDLCHLAAAAVIAHRPGKSWVWQSHAHSQSDASEDLLGHIHDGKKKTARLECTHGQGSFRWRHLNNGNLGGCGEWLATPSDAVRAYFETMAPTLVDRSTRLDTERFDLVVDRGNGNAVTLNSSPLTHREAVTMQSKQSDSTRPFTRLISLGYLGAAVGRTPEELIDLARDILEGVKINVDLTDCLTIDPTMEDAEAGIQTAALAVKAWANGEIARDLADTVEGAIQSWVMNAQDYDQTPENADEDPLSALADACLTYRAKLEENAEIMERQTHNALNYLANAENCLMQCEHSFYPHARKAIDLINKAVGVLSDFQVK